MSVPTPADLSVVQQDLVDMNQRYEMLEERLLDRQQELKAMLDTVKAFLQVYTIHSLKILEYRVVLYRVEPYL